MLGRIPSHHVNTLPIGKVLDQFLKIFTTYDCSEDKPKFLLSQPMLPEMSLPILLSNAHVLV
jgi:hypothetical protein